MAPREQHLFEGDWGQEGILLCLGEESGILKQGLRILILVPQTINGKAVITFCDVFNKAKSTIDLLAKIYGIFVISG